MKAGKTPIIFCNENFLYWTAISERIEYQELNVEILKVRKLNDVIRNIPEKGRCIILTESVLIGEGKVSDLPDKCRSKNPESIVILYTGETYSMNVSLFDHHVNSYGEDSFDEIFVLLEKYC